MEGDVMSPCHNLEPSLVARDSSRLLSVKPNQWMHHEPLPMHTGIKRRQVYPVANFANFANFVGVFSLVREDRGFQVNPLCRHDITSPYPPSGNEGYVRKLVVNFFKGYDVHMFFVEETIQAVSSMEKRWPTIKDSVDIWIKCLVNSILNKHMIVQ